MDYKFIECIFFLILLKYQTKSFLDFINDNSIKYDYQGNNNLNKLSIGNKDKDYKIKELEKYIKELELKLEEKDIIIKEEKLKNENLNKIIKELQNFPDSNSQINKIIELENEIKLFRKYYRFYEGEELISIKIVSVEKDVDYSLIIKNTEKFTKIGSILYEKYPKYIETENVFLCGGNRINIHKSLKENKIKNGDIIIIAVKEID